jgi:hypothetical protein
MWKKVQFWLFLISRSYLWNVYFNLQVVLKTTSRNLSGYIQGIYLHTKYH